MIQCRRKDDGALVKCIVFFGDSFIGRVLLRLLLNPSVTTCVPCTVNGLDQRAYLDVMGSDIMAAYPPGARWF